jgi:hypothetical protein
MKGWQINKIEHKERAEDKEFFAVTITRVKNAVLRDIIHVQDFQMYIS